MSKRPYQYIYLPFASILIMWLLTAAEYTLGIELKTFGIYPRKLEGLPGIISSPFIHGDFNHLLSNTFPFFFLFTAILYFYKRMALQIILFSWLLTGIAVWLGGRYSWHIGASGLVYAFASFMFFAGILSKEKPMIAISLLVIFLYGGMIWGVLPGKVNISWESHLFGFLAGFIVAFYIGRPAPSIKVENNPSSAKDYNEVNSTVDKYFQIFYSYRENQD